MLIWNILFHCISKELFNCILYAFYNVFGKKNLAEGGISLGEYPHHVWAACLIETLSATVVVAGLSLLVVTTQEKVNLISYIFSWCQNSKKIYHALYFTKLLTTLNNCGPNRTFVLGNFCVNFFWCFEITLWTLRII